MKQYQDLLKTIIAAAKKKDDRTGTGTISLFGHQMRFKDVHRAFPLVTCKKTNFNAVVHELIWFLRGETNIQYLKDNNVKIWDEWADEDGNLGPVYGKQWRDFNGVDQIQSVINDLKSNPDSRRMIVSAWNPEVLPDISFSPNENATNGKQALPPCHTMFQFYTLEMSDDERIQAFCLDRSRSPDRYSTDVYYDVMDFCNDGDLESACVLLDEISFPTRRLSCQLYQRSADCFLGVPFNIASYSLLTIVIAGLTNMIPGDFVHTFGDYHIYNNHIDLAKEASERKSHALPYVVFNGEGKDLDQIEFSDFDLIGYRHEPFMKAAVSV